MKKLLTLSLSTCLILLLSHPVIADGHGGKGHKKNKIGKMFDQTDANEDGQLDLNEFLAHAEQRFQAMDLNQDGYVTKEEGREAHQKMRAERREKHRERRKNRESESSDTE